MIYGSRLRLSGSINWRVWISGFFPFAKVGVFPVDSRWPLLSCHLGSGWVNVSLPVCPDVDVQYLIIDHSCVCCTIVNKLSQFQTFVYSTSLDVIALSETWLTDSVFNNEIFPTNFAIYCSDRGSRGGGVMLCASSWIPSHLLHSHTTWSTFSDCLTYRIVSCI